MRPSTRSRAGKTCTAALHPTGAASASSTQPCWVSLIFVEVALTTGLASSVQPLLARDGDERAEREREKTADTAIFYSISNCQDGLRGVSFGNFLIKQVVEELKAELPRVAHFST